MRSPHLIGCDFSSRPTRRKPIVIAQGTWQSEADGLVLLDGLERLETLDAYAQWVARPGAWVGGFDLPFGLPRELVVALGWPTEWESCIRHYAGLSRADIHSRFMAFCAARPVGGKFAHRATDVPAGSSPSMKWVNPPVAYMLHAGVLPLIDGGVYLPGLQPAPSADHHAAGTGDMRVAMEAYPGLLAREILGHTSYKSDDKSRQTPERQARRALLVTALEAGSTRLAVRLGLSRAQRALLIEDASGDSLDAVLCLLQAAWGWKQGAPRFGLPLELDPLEGWIVSAPRPGAAT